ncbi:uncharacterized conserved protein [Sanguibacter keddieii DSM 10542]|uniref:UPF0225 protein Sked_12610 n=1 Tax=Sanguibacter keddieii (strain ATCC 51767 / DSM 10542 / NCFB 3025 / ST-74) TaxID=446469 RepID=D1BEC5_SANKS|nr:YchJ family metal-binding protein [Sanguibacter keddieii]ACZ21203.1 uncharacterized conserved protein [Sanguibacter keddieii DSM 10542]
MSPALDLTSPCPCGTGRLAAACCAPVHSGEEPARTAEALMRSRYSAFAAGDVDHLLASWHPQTRPADLELDPDTVWTRLRVLETVDGGETDDTGTVAFRAHSRHDGERSTQTEVSRFVRSDDDARRWLYLDAVEQPPQE